MAEAFKIESGVPIKGGSKLSRSPLSVAVRILMTANIGDSFLAPADPKVKSLNGKITEYAYRIGGKGWITIRKQSDGSFRVWKIAEPKER